MSPTISQRIQQTGYGCSRPNKTGCHLWRWGYRGGWHQLPTTYSPRFLLLVKAHALHEHSGSPYHTCVHCKELLTAAPRRAGTSISVSLSGQPLSRPVRILDLVVRYTTNNLIRRRLIFRRRNFGRKIIPEIIFYPVLASVFQGYSRPKGRLSTCY